MKSALSDHPPCSAHLEQTLEHLLNPRRDPARRLVRLERRPSDYASSYPLEELTVDFQDGTRLELVFKDLSPGRLPPAARRAKPEFLQDSRREIAVYRAVLAKQGLDTATCYGSLIDEALGRYWLFLQRIDGPALHEVGDFKVWKSAAGWLAGFHHRLAGRRGNGFAELPLIRYDRQYYARWLARAHDFCGGSLPRRLASHYPQLIDELLRLPASIIHGEFYASNVLAEAAAGRICPVDWEQAAWGPALVDLAALSAGKWAEPQRAALAEHYYETLCSHQGSRLSPQAFRRGLWLCRLHLAVQWLGWSRDWSPPAAHRQDWLAEADRMTHLLVS